MKRARLHQVRRILIEASRGIAAALESAARVPRGFAMATILKLRALASEEAMATQQTRGLARLMIAPSVIAAVRLDERPAGDDDLFLDSCTTIC